MVPRVRRTADVPPVPLLTIRPDSARYWASTGGGRQLASFLLFSVIVVVLASRASGWQVVRVIILVAIVFVTGIGATWWHFVRGKIVVTPTELVMQRLVGPPRKFRRSSVGGAVYALQYRLESGKKVLHVPRVYIMDNSARSVLKLESVYYPKPLMESLITALNLNVDVISESINAAQMHLKYPRLLTFTDRHVNTVILLRRLVPVLLIIAMLQFWF